MALLRSLALALACVAPLARAQCTGSTYSYLASPAPASCAPCVSGASFVSAAAGCTPPPADGPGPTDTAFYLSGSSAEGVSAFAATGPAPTFVADNRGRAGGAISLGAGTYLASTSASPALAAALPAAEAAGATLAALVRCSAPGLPSSAQGAVLEWGSADAAGAGTKLGLLVAPGGDTRMYADVLTGKGSYGVTLAGSGAAGGADGVGTNATLNAPFYLAFDSDGNLLAADFSGQKVRRIAMDGTTTTVAGRGVAGGADGPSSSATFSNPIGMAQDPISGDIFVIEYTAGATPGRIRRVFGNATSPRTVSAFAGSSATSLGEANAVLSSGTGLYTYPALGFSGGHQMVFDNLGNLYYTDSTNNKVRMIPVFGGASRIVAGQNAGMAEGVGTNAGFNQPYGICLDPTNTILYVVSSASHRVFRLFLSNSSAVFFAGSGVAGFTDGVGTVATFRTPSSCWVDASGANVYIGDGGAAGAGSGNNRVRKINVATRMVSTLDYTGFGTSPTVGQPYGVIIDSLGNLFVADRTRNRVVKIAQPINAAAPGSPLPLPVCDGKWHHVAMTTKASGGFGAGSGPSASLNLYVDGSLLGAGGNSSFALPASGASLRIGWSGLLSSNGGDLFSGALADLRMYKRALSPAEVLALSQPISACTFPCVAPSPVEGASSYTYTCAAGFSGGAVLARSFTTYVWGWLSGPPSCTCSPGSLLTGSGASATCTACPAGSFSASPTDASCTLCTAVDANAVAPAPGSATCGCAAGFTASGSGATLKCTCAAGSALSGGGSVCTPCAPGSFSAAAASETCTPCAASTYAAAAGASACAACPAGATGAAGAGATGSATCVCGVNTYSTGALATLACPACPAGSQSATNSTSCTCSANFKTNNAFSAALKCSCPDQWLVAGTGAAQMCSPPPASAALTSGNLVALRVGDGLTALTTALAQAFIDEFTPSGTLVQSIGAPLGMSGTDPTVGALTHSADGVYVVFAGVTGVGSGQTFGGATPLFGAFARAAVARFDASGAINASTTLSAAAYNGVLRSACSPDGSFYILVGNATGSNAGLTSVAHGGGDAGLARVLASPTDVSACYAASSASLLLARASPGAPSVGGTIVASAPMPAAAGAALAAPTALNGGAVLTQPGHPSYFATQLAVSASGQTIFVSDLQSAGPPSPPNPSVWVSLNAGATFDFFIIGRVVTGLQLSGDEKTLFFTTPLGLFSVATSCSPLPCTNIAALAGFTAGTGKEFRGLALVPCRVGQYGPSCVPCARGTFSDVLGAATCAGSCPAGATTSNPGQTSAANCYCVANYFKSSGAGAPLVCSPCPLDGNSTAGASACTCTNPWAYFDAPTGTCVLPPSSTPTAAASVTPSVTATISVTPSLSTTSTASLTSSPSLTSTPSLTRTPSGSTTASISATPSQSPSPTSVPDVLFAFSFSISPSSSTLRPSDVVGSQRVMSAVTTGFASLLGVLASQVSIKNVTDIGACGGGKGGGWIVAPAPH